jgi:hypothetical protein
MDYANECAAHTAGVSVSRTGECSVVEEDVTETSAETLPEVLSSLASSSASSFIATIMTLTVVVGQMV